MTSTLPTRWQEILRREAAANVGSVLAQAREQPDVQRVPRWTTPALVVAVASVSLLGILRGSEVKGTGSLPFDRSTVISTRTAGLGANAEDLAPQAMATPVPMPPVEPPSVSVPVDRRESRVPRRVARHDERACPECEKRREALIQGPRPAPEPSDRAPASPAEEPQPLLINIGTRFSALLTDPVVTGAALAPASARLTTDVYVGDRLAIPAGTPLVGEGFATQQDDRAQVVFTAMVKDGKTLPLEAWALHDGEIGVRGKVVRKGSKGKRGAGAVLGGAASALTFGLSGAVPGRGGAALGSLGNTVAGDLASLGRDWRPSDKVVRVEAGVPITVYLRRDLTVE